MTKRICAIILSIIVIHAGGYAQSGDAHLRNYISAAKSAMDNNTTCDAIAHLKNAINVVLDNFVLLYMLGSGYSYINDNTNAAKYYSEALNLINSSNTIFSKVL